MFVYRFHRPLERSSVLPYVLDSHFSVKPKTIQYLLDGLEGLAPTNAKV
jgi:hypothetical protein